MFSSVLTENKSSNMDWFELICFSCFTKIMQDKDKTGISVM